jgi:hypothetical protein
MLRKIYVQNGTRVFLCDSPFAREINSVLKDAQLNINNSGVNLSRNGKEIAINFEDIGLEEDEESFYLEVEGF